MAKKRTKKRRVATKRKVATKKSIAIGTWPTPELPKIEIPARILREFEKDMRIVIRHPWVVGIPIPERLLRRDLLQRFKGFDIMLVPKETRK